MTNPTETTRLLSLPAPAVLDYGEEPRNWRISYRWLCVGVVSTYALMSPIMAAIIVPAMPEIAKDLDVTDEGVSQALISVYVLGWGMAPVVVGPLSEVYGRVGLLNTGHGLFMVFNLMCMFARSRTQLLALRLCAGIAGSGPISIGAGVLADLWAPEQRGLSMALYTLGPLLGPAIAPIAGAYITRHWSWRWIFFWCSSWIFVSWIFGLVVLRETFRPVLIKRKAKKLRLLHPECGPVKDDDGRSGDLIQSLARDLRRPFILLGTQPIIQVLALFMGYLFGLNQLTITTFQGLWMQMYHQTRSRAALNYISIAAGFVLGSQVTGRLNDYIYTSGKKTPTPELRTLLMFPAALLVPVGEILYGWSVEARLHWLIPNIGVGIYSFGVIVSYQCIQAYVLDCYPVYAASAMGALTIFRSLLGFLFPIFAPEMYARLGYGWGCTLLAGCATVLGVGIPYLLRVHGKELRERSQFAAGDREIEY